MVKASTIAAEVAKTPFRIARVASRFLPKTGKPPLFLFGFNDWKTFMHDWFPEHEVIFAPMNLWPVEFEIDWKWRILADPRAKVLAWQYKGPPQLKAFCNRYGVPFHYVEDGFIRSISLGALHTPPLSMVFDAQDMYFNSTAPSDLESILCTYDFDTNPALTDRARSVMDRLQATRISKYNAAGGIDIESIYGPKDGKRILVIGQVERDASIAYGCSRRYSNNDLVWLAKRENPDGQIIYKPHPEVLRGTAEAVSNPDHVRGAALVLDQDIILADAMETIDHVYTITSLSGFEALMKGIEVTTVGCPFYSGWGLTDDRQPNDRRGRKLTVEQVFAAAYILYPRYFDPISKKPIEIEDAIDLLSWMRTHQPTPKEPSPPVADPIGELVRLVALRLHQADA